MKISHYILAGMIALSAGCSTQKSERVQGQETILRVGNNVKAYADITGNEQVDLYCSGDATTSHPYDNNTLRGDRGARCFVSSSYKNSGRAATEYEARFEQSSLLDLTKVPEMDKEMEVKVNAEYAALNAFGK